MKLEFIPVRMRLPLKFGGETVDSILCAKVALPAYGAVGWGETPLSVGWAWPGKLPFAYREEKMRRFCEFLSTRYLTGPETHPLFTGYEFIQHQLPVLLKEFCKKESCEMPYLAALICLSPFDLALHDAYGKSLNLPVYETYTKKYMPYDLAWFYKDDAFRGLYPQDFFVEPPDTLPVWHLVGGKDRLEGKTQLQDGYPDTLREWIHRDGLTSLKIKLTGVDAAWDLERLCSVGKIALETGVEALSPDFNCMVKDPAYVNDILDQLKQKAPAVYERLLYVEQPFPYELEEFPIDVHSVSARKPLFMDESAHDWQHVCRGFELGWTGVALKVCKTQTGALLSACWAKKHGMALMVQDLTNPMLAQIPHAQLARYIGTIRGVECNAPQFYPQASVDFEKRHPGLYERRHGIIRVSSLSGPGFGYAKEDWL